MFSAFANPSPTPTPTFNAFSAFTPSTSPPPPPTSAFPSPSAFPPTSAFAASTPAPAPLKSAFASSTTSPPAPAPVTPLKSAFSTQPRPPPHLIAPKPPSFTSKLNPAARPFSLSPARSPLTSVAEGEEQEDIPTEEEAEHDVDVDEGGEVAEEEAEIVRLEQERANRKARFMSASTTPATSTPSSSSTSAAKLAVARAAGMLLPDDDGDGGDEADGEVYGEVNASTRIKGLCTTMCPHKELIDRLESHTISPLELPPGFPIASLTPTTPVPHAIKKYRRAAAAQRLDPKDVRTPATLTATCQHLIDSVVDRVDVEWAEVHRFVTDRFRAVRSDFVCQGLVEESTVQCLEWMARFHVLAFDVLSHEVKETFDPIQNMEKLTQTLTSLRLLYRDNAASDHPFPTPHQAEMQGYLLFSNFNKNLLQAYTSLPPSLQSSPPVQFALSCYNAMKEDQYATFFALFHRATYLQACLMLWYVARVRGRGLEVMSRGYQRYPVEGLMELMCMEDERKTVEMVQWYGMKVDEERGEISFINGGRGGTRQQFIHNEHGLYTEDKAQRVMATKRPRTKREAILTPYTPGPTPQLSAPRPQQSTGVDRGHRREERNAIILRQTSREEKPSPSTVQTSFPPSSSSSSSFSAPPAASTSRPPATPPVSRPQSTSAFPPTLPAPSTSSRPSPASTLFNAASPQPSPFSASPPSSASVASTAPRKHVTFNVPSPVSTMPPPTAVTQRSPRHSTSTAFTAASFSAVSSFTAPALSLSASSASYQPPSSPFRPPTDHPSSLSAPPLIRSLSSQQREERQRLELEEQRQQQQRQHEHELTLRMMNTARTHFLSSRIRRWARAVSHARRTRELHHVEEQKADAFYSYGVMVTAFLQWYGAFRVREERRWNEAEMRRQMSEGQHGLSAVPSGLIATQEKLRQLLGYTALPLHTSSTLPHSDVDMADADGDDVEVDSASPPSPSPASSLDVADLVSSVLHEKNPTYSELYFHVIVSVDSEASPFTDLLLQKLGSTSSYPLSPVNGRRPSGENEDDGNALVPVLQHSRPIASYTVRGGRHVPPLHVLFRPQVGARSSSTVWMGCQGALVLLSSALGVEDVPSLMIDDASTTSPHALVLPPPSRFESDRRRLSTLLASLHRQSRVPLVILYPLSVSALQFLHSGGVDVSARFQQHSAMMLAQALGLSSIDAQRVSDVSLSPLFLPSHLFSSSYTPSSSSLFAGLNDECLASALTYIASSSPAYPVLHRIDVPMSVEAKVQPCLTYLRQVTDRLASVIPSLPAFPVDGAAVGRRDALYRAFTPQWYVDHFNASVRSYKKRLFGRGLKDLSWPPMKTAADAASTFSASSPRVTRIRGLLDHLPLPSFPAHARQEVLDWTWGKSHSCVVAYLASYRPLSAVTSREEEEVDASIGSDLYGLYHKAEMLFSLSARKGSEVSSDVNGRLDEGVDERVERVGGEERLERLKGWVEWMEALIRHRLEELMMHPHMIEDDQHIAALIDLHSLTRHIDTPTHSHALPILSPPTPTPRRPHINGHSPPPPPQRTPAKKRKVDAELTPQRRVPENGVRGVGRSVGEVSTAPPSPSSSSSALLGALDAERDRQRRLSALLSELEAQWK